MIIITTHETSATYQALADKRFLGEYILLSLVLPFWYYWWRQQVY